MKRFRQLLAAQVFPSALAFIHATHANQKISDQKSPMGLGVDSAALKRLERDRCTCRSCSDIKSLPRNLVESLAA